MPEKVVILTPFLNEEESLNRLLTELTVALKEFKETAFTMLVVDDGSTGNFRITAPVLFPIQVLHLQRNIGHQKAIAVGLAHIKAAVSCDKVLVMDADGEDRPEDRLVCAAAGIRQVGP